jgi:uncharacterized protein YecT (DUF1311 family)
VQNINGVINMFGGLMKAAITEGTRTEWRKLSPAELACMEDRLQRQGASTDILAQQGIFPNDGRVAGIRAFCARAAAAIPTQAPVPPTAQPTVPSTPQSLSLHPTFDCSVVQSALGSILCADKAGATADWAVDTAFRAAKYSLPEAARDALSHSHDDWIQTVSQKCRLSRRDPAYSPQQRQCVLNEYGVRTNTYRSRLQGDALAETQFSPDERADLQSRLINLGLLDGPADVPSTESCIPVRPNTRISIAVPPPA